MKHLKNLFAAALTLVVAMTLSVTAFAAGTGSITITPPDDVDPDATITYKIYKVFDADASADGSAVSYKLVSGKTSAPTGFTVDGAGNVSYAGAAGATALTQADIDAIAAYVENDTPVATVTSTGGAAAVAENLPNGFYYITTTTGTVVTIDTAKPNAEVDDKNVVPGVDKVINATDPDYGSYDKDGKKALAQVGTEVEYKATITVGKGQTGYVFKDTLGTGLEYVDGSLAVAGMTADTDYTLSVSGQNITVTFKDDSIKDLEQGAEIVVTYKATVTSDALQDNPAKNTATISYGNNSEFTSEPSEVEVYNAKISVIKYDGAKANNKYLAGAGFVLKNAAGKYYKITNGVVSWVDTEADATEYTSGADGKLNGEFTGLANGTYTLIEKTVPAGYNKAADQTFTIDKGDYTAENLKQQAEVENNKGSVLPSTGGMGTTLFYVVGGLMVAGAAIALIAKSRVAKMEA